MNRLLCPLPFHQLLVTQGSVTESWHACTTLPPPEPPTWGRRRQAATTFVMVLVSTSITAVANCGGVVGIPFGVMMPPLLYVPPAHDVYRVMQDICITA